MTKPSFREIQIEAYFIGERNPKQTPQENWLQAEKKLLMEYLTPNMIIENDWGKQDQ